MTRQLGGWWRFLLAFALLAGTAIILHARGQEEKVPPAEPLSTFPTQIGNWTGRVVEIPQWALEVLGQGEFAERAYNRSANEPSVDLYIAYFPTQRNGSTMHSPQNCLPGSGWTPVETSRIDLPRLGGGQFKANRYVLARGLDRLLVYYWFQEHGRAVASEYWSKYYLIVDSIELARSDGALIRVSTAIPANGNPSDADQRNIAFVRSFLPLLNNYIPQ